MTSEDQIIDKVAVALWVEEARHAAPNVVKNRNAQTFLEQSDRDIDAWRGMARAAIGAISPAAPSTELTTRERLIERMARAVSVELFGYDSLPEPMFGEYAQGSKIGQSMRVARVAVAAMPSVQEADMSTKLRSIMTNACDETRAIRNKPEVAVPTRYWHQLMDLARASGGDR